MPSGGTLMGADANEPLKVDQLLLDGRTWVGRYISDDGYPRNLSRSEADIYASVGINLCMFWENGHSDEIWQGRDGREVGWVSRQQMAVLGGQGKPVVYTADKFVTDHGKWPIAPVLRYFMGVRTEMPQWRVWAYGTRYLLDQLFRQGLIGGGIQTNLFDRFYNPVVRQFQKRQHPLAWGRQYENCDLTGHTHYGAGGYVCLDVGYTRLPSPLWVPA